MSADIGATRVGGSVAEWLGRWTSYPKTLGSIPALIACWICSNPQQKVVNIQLVCLYAVGIVSLVTFISQFQVVSSLCFKTKLRVRSL